MKCYIKTAALPVWKDKNMKKLLSLFCILCLALTACAETNNESSSASDSTSDTLSTESFVGSDSSTDEKSAEESSVTEEDVTKILDTSKLVVFGDSITALGSWGKAVADDLNMYYFNGAMGGITSAEGLERFSSYVANRSPDFVTICFGMNDLLMTTKNKPKVNHENFYKNLVKMVTDVRALGAVPILMTTNPLNNDVFFASQGQSSALYEDVGTPLEWLDTYNDITRKAAEDTDCYLIDIRKACNEFSVTSLLNADGIHLNAKGNDIFAQTISAFMEATFERDPSAPDVTGDIYSVLEKGETASLISFDAADWFAPAKNTMNIKGGDSLILKNLKNLWPDIHYAPDNPIAFSKDSSLHIAFTTANVNTSVLLYFNGASPSAYTDGNYICLNPYFNCSIAAGSGDVAANQTVDITIDLSSLPIPKDSSGERIIFSGAKIYVAGSAYQPVTFTAFEVTGG